MSTLEKIRAEIDVIEINGQVDEHTAFIRTGEHVKQMALDIIDKYAEQEPCDDVVSRQAVLKMAYDMSEIDGEHFTEPCMVVDVEDIQKLSSVRPQEQTGKWLDYRDDGFVECPFCGHATNCEDDIDELHYCFYCGAKMVEPQESEVRNDRVI